MITAFSLHDTDFIQVLYIVAFSLFIYGLMGLTGPKTAVMGNRIAAVGMAIAVIATFLIPGMGNWGLIAIGIAIGTAVGVPAARRVQMTAMPQMVALFNGVGGVLNKVLLVIAIAFGTINVVGGFLVTDRMLEMFKGGPGAGRAKKQPEVEAGARQEELGA